MLRHSTISWISRDCETGPSISIYRGFRNRRLRNGARQQPAERTCYQALARGIAIMIANLAGVFARGNPSERALTLRALLTVSGES